jgi:hypothetical protein
VLEDDWFPEREEVPYKEKVDEGKEVADAKGKAIPSEEETKIPTSRGDTEERGAPDTHISPDT